jgi:cytochrome c
MKKIILSTLSITVLFLSSFAADSKKLIDGKTLFQQKGKAIVDPTKESIMKPNLNTTKAMKDDELKALVKYILSNK